jgi:hypothetical protein
MNRKQFLTLGAACVALPFLVPRRGAPLLSRVAGPIRLFPVEGRTYSPTFLQFMETARFESPRHAMLSVRSQEVEYEIGFAEESV